MEFLSPPKEFIITGDLGRNWKAWKENFKVYLSASGCINKEKEIQAAVLLHSIVREVTEILNLLSIMDEQKKDSDGIITMLDGYFIPKTNLSFACHKFNTRVQLPNENFDNFLNELRKLAADCDFGTLHDRLIKDIIVYGVKDQRIKDRLLREADLDLTKAANIYKAAERTEEDIKNLAEKTSSLEIDGIQVQHRDAIKKIPVHIGNGGESGSNVRLQRQQWRNGDMREGRFHSQQQMREVGTDGNLVRNGQLGQRQRYQGQGRGCGWCG